MAITRSDLFVFSAGLAAGAVACATYPKWKAKLEPMLAGVIAGAGAAFAEAKQAADRATSDPADAQAETTVSPAGDGNVTPNIIPLTL
jgi:hypothetical protein